MEHRSFQLLSMVVQNRLVSNVGLKPWLLLCHFVSFSSNTILSGMAIGRLHSNLSQMLMCYMSLCQAFRFSASVLVIMGIIIPAHPMSQAGWEAWVYLKIQKEALKPSQRSILSIQRFYYLLLLSIFPGYSIVKICGWHFIFFSFLLKDKIHF